MNTEMQLTVYDYTSRTSDFIDFRFGNLKIMPFVLLKGYS